MRVEPCEPLAGLGACIEPGMLGTNCGGEASPKGSIGSAVWNNATLQGAAGQWAEASRPSQTNPQYRGELGACPWAHAWPWGRPAYAYGFAISAGHSHWLNTMCGRCTLTETWIGPGKPASWCGGQYMICYTWAWQGTPRQTWLGTHVLGCHKHSGVEPAAMCLSVYSSVWHWVERACPVKSSTCDH